MKSLYTFIILAAMLLPAGCSDSLVDSNNSDNRVSRVETQSFSDASIAYLDVQNFVGNITVEAGPAGVIGVTATRRAEREEDLDDIVITMTRNGANVQLTAVGPNDTDNRSVDFEITAPPELQQRLLLGVGNITSAIRPTGACFYDVGVGNITLLFPSDLNATVNLAAGVGNITVTLPVSGTTTNKTVTGTIGTGQGASILANVGVGNIIVGG